jgi:hypothetical protein
MADGGARSSGRWVKGVSGNRSGRAKAHPDVRAKIAAALPSVVDMLVEVVENQGEDIDRRITAGRTLLDWGIATPKDAVAGETAAQALAKLADALTEKP